MQKFTKKGLKVICVGCKKTEIVPWEEAKKITGVKMCSCGMPMVVHSASR